MKVIDEKYIKEITPKQIAEAFANMPSDEQAEFFSHFAEIAFGWPVQDGLFIQLHSISRENNLTEQGKNAMRLIGESVSF